VERRTVAAIGLGRPAWRAVLAALAVNVACTAVSTLLAVALGLTTPARVPALSAWPLTAAVLTMFTRSFLLQGLPEEVLFRGYLVQTALGRLPLWGVTALSVLVFGVLHLVSGSGATTVTQRVLFLLLPIGFALLATAFRLRTGSVWPAVAVHGGFHVSWWVASLWVAPRPETLGAYFAVAGGVLVAAGLAATIHTLRHPAAVITPTLATDAPAPTTEAPVDTAEAPVDTAEAPAPRTAASVDTTARPAGTADAAGTTDAAGAVTRSAG
jgi:uncharacterized protein